MKGFKTIAMVLTISLLCACAGQAGSSTGASETADSGAAAELEALQAQIDELTSENEALRDGLNGKTEDAQSAQPEEPPLEETIEAQPDSEPANEAEPQNESNEGYGRTNPAPIGTEQTVTVEDWDETYTVTMVVNWVNRGEDAWYYIQEANRFNDPPSEGKEYIIANITATVVDSENDLAVDFNQYDFTLFSENSSEYELVSVVEPEPEFEGEAYSGASITGNVVFSVDSTDLAPKIAYARDYDGSGGIWMALFY